MLRPQSRHCPETVGWYSRAVSGTVRRRFAHGSSATRRAEILIHGTEDSSVPYDFSASYQETARARGDNAELVTQQGAGHFEMVDPRSNEWRDVLHAVRKEAVVE